MRPILRAHHETGTNGIHANIVGLLIELFWRAQTVIKEIPLPNHAEMPRPPTLKVGNLMPHAPGMIPLSNHMQMLGN